MTLSPARSDVASGLSNVTHTRSNRSHHPLRLYSWVRCPPDEQTSRTMGSVRLGVTSLRARRPQVTKLARRTPARRHLRARRGSEGAGFALPLPLPLAGAVRPRTAIEARRRRTCPPRREPRPRRTRIRTRSRRTQCRFESDTLFRDAAAHRRADLTQLVERRARSRRAWWSRPARRGGPRRRAARSPGSRRARAPAGSRG